MKKTGAERYRNIDFSDAKRGPAVRPEPGKTKISIRLDNTVLDYFRGVVDKAGGDVAKSQNGIVFIDEIDKLKSIDGQPRSVSGETSPCNCLFGPR